MPTVRRLIARSNAIWTGNDRSTDDATVRTGFVLNLANPPDIVLERCRPEFLALLYICPYPSLRLPSISSSLVRRPPSPHPPLHPLLHNLLQLSLHHPSTAVTRDPQLLHLHHTLLHGNASRQHGTRQRSGPRGLSAPTAPGILPTTPASWIRHVGCCGLLIPGTTTGAHTASRAAIPTASATTTTPTATTTKAATASVSSFTPSRGEEALPSVHLESPRVCW